MQRLTWAAGALSLALAISAAHAQQEVVSGTVSQIDQEARTVTLSDGQTFTLPGTYELSDVQVGDQVTVSYQTENGVNTVSSMESAGSGESDDDSGETGLSGTGSAEPPGAGSTSGEGDSGSNESGDSDSGSSSSGSDSDSSGGDSGSSN